MRLGIREQDIKEAHSHTPFWKERQSEGRSCVFEHHLGGLVRKGPVGRQCLLWLGCDSEQPFPVGMS